MKSLDEMDHYEVLEVPYDARPEEIARGYALVRDAYEGESLAAYSVFAPDEAKLWRERIDEAWRVLSDPVARRRYDAALAAARAGVAEPDGGQAELAFAAAAPEPLDPHELPVEPFEPAPPPPIAEEPAPGAAPRLPRELRPFEEEDAGADEAWCGARLRRSRLLRGLEIEDVAAATKINPTYLRFLEEERFDDLPAVVYVRGFVAAYARHLGLAAAQVSRSYVGRCEQHRSARPRGRLLGS